MSDQVPGAPAPQPSHSYTFDNRLPVADVETALKSVFGNVIISAEPFNGSPARIVVACTETIDSSKAAVILWGADDTPAESKPEESNSNEPAADVKAPVAESTGVGVVEPTTAPPAPAPVVPVVKTVVPTPPPAAK